MCTEKQQQQNLRHFPTDEGIYLCRFGFWIKKIVKLNRNFTFLSVSLFRLLSFANFLFYLAKCTSFCIRNVNVVSWWLFVSTYWYSNVSMLCIDFAEKKRRHTIFILFLTISITLISIEAKLSYTRLNAKGIWKKRPTTDTKTKNQKCWSIFLVMWL